MRLNSLALRLFFSATTWIVIILVATALVLFSIYRTAVERAFDEHAVEFSLGHSSFETLRGDARFEAIMKAVSRPKDNQ